jgi:hypothetical protein
VCSSDLKDLYDNNPDAKKLFENANEILGFRIPKPCLMVLKKN